MSDESKLKIIKTAHTLIWLFFNVVIFYMCYAVVVNKLDGRLWICYGLILGEGIILLLFKLHCPLTIWARRYSNSTKDNFDIYLPNWLAKYNKQVYVTIIIGITLFLIVRLAK